jgi:hypothetical protein
MYRLRYYDEAYHPDHFKRGMRGWFIVVLNWIRWKLETYVQKQALKFFTENGGLPRDRVKELLRTFHLDVQAEKLEKEQLSPLYAVAAEAAETPRSRAARYTEGRKATMLNDLTPPGEDQPVRPKPLDNLIGQYAFGGRATNYVHGRRFLADPEGDFEPLESDDDGSLGDRSGSVDGSRSGSGGRRGNALLLGSEVAKDRGQGRRSTQGRNR